MILPAIAGAIICAAIVIVAVVLWAAAALNGQTVGRPEDVEVLRRETPWQ